MNDRVDGREAEEPATGLRGAVVHPGLDALVCAAVEDEAERRLQAGALALLVLSGMGAAALSPILAMAGHGAPALVLPLVAASLCFCAAAYLSATGAFDRVAGLAGLAAAAGAGALGLRFPFLATPLLLLVAFAGVETAISGRRALAVAILGGAGVAFCVLALSAGALPGLGPLEALLGAGFAGQLAWRLGRRQRGGEGPREDAPTASERFLALGDEMGRAVLRIDLDGRTLGLSRAAAARLDDGAARAAPVPASLFESLQVADRVLYLQALREVAGKGEERLLAVRLRGNGSPAHARACLRLSPLRGCGQLLAEILPACTAAEEPELREALESAHQSSAAKTQFLAAMSHELRTPLNAIIGFSDILDQEFFGGFETERQKEYVGLIRQSGQHLLSVVNTLLDVSKIEAGRYELFPEPFVLDEALSGASDVVRDEALRKGLTLDIRSGTGGEVMVADRRACHQILLNLLSNAVKFTESGVVSLESRSRDGWVEISVCDTGIGISAQDIERLGEPFTQGSGGIARRYQGTGLGLSLVKGLAELHGGTLRIRSQLGVGTEVTVRLPSDCENPPAAQRSLKEIIVALSDARTKTSPETPNRETRRSA